MEKGLEISFQVAGGEGKKIVEALANLVGNEFIGELELQWRIFDVTLGKERFYKVCYSGPKLSRLHPHIEKRIKSRFDELAHFSMDDLMSKYHEERKGSGFKIQNIQELKEEYDLWQDNFWQYF
jgi:hypothetical protein